MLIKNKNFLNFKLWLQIRGWLKLCTHSSLYGFSIWQWFGLEILNSDFLTKFWRYSRQSLQRLSTRVCKYFRPFESLHGLWTGIFTTPVGHFEQSFVVVGYQLWLHVNLDWTMNLDCLVPTFSYPSRVLVLDLPDCNADGYYKAVQFDQNDCWGSTVSITVRQINSSENVSIEFHQIVVLRSGGFRRLITDWFDLSIINSWPIDCWYIETKRIGCGRQSGRSGRIYRGGCIGRSGCGGSSGHTGNSNQGTSSWLGKYFHSFILFRLILEIELFIKQGRIASGKFNVQ